MTTQHKDHRHFHLRNFLLRAGQTSLWASEWESWRRNCLRDMFRYMQCMTAWVITDYDDFDKIILWPGRQQLQATTHQYPNTTSQEGSQVFISLHSVQFVKYIFIYTLQCAVFKYLVILQRRCPHGYSYVCPSRSDGSCLPRMIRLNKNLWLSIMFRWNLNQSDNSSTELHSRPC